MTVIPIYVMNDKTPKGDGNFKISIFKTNVYMIVMNDKTPKGDGNEGLFFRPLFIMLVMNDKTPKGDGNLRGYNAYVHRRHSYE